jgi:Amt family ammonium transporter
MAIDSGATAWILAATALVMIMTPGVGFFYGGLVRRKNLISMITLSFVAFALVSIQWVVIGYSLAFGNNPAGSLNGFIGDLQYLGLTNVGLDAGPYSTAIPGLLFMVFQLVFAR